MQKDEKGTGDAIPCIREPDEDLRHSGKIGRG
jgi:hypothetical protein